MTIFRMAKVADMFVEALENAMNRERLAAGGKEVLPSSVQGRRP
jgi:hypothetical protein